MSAKTDAVFQKFSEIGIIPVVVLNDVNPPVTGNFNANSYVEDNPNYVDITKADVMESVDAIINELKGTIDKIKSQLSSI